MYAVHIRLVVPGPAPSPLDIHEITRELTASSDIFVQHVYAPRTRELGHSAVLYVTSPSVRSAGERIAAVVRHMLQGRGVAVELVISADPRLAGLCDAAIRVTAPAEARRTVGGMAS